MLTNATIALYDVMGDIVICAHVRQQEAPESPWETTLLRTQATTSVGETEPHEWLKDCLVALIETL